MAGQETGLIEVYVGEGKGRIVASLAVLGLGILTSENGSRVCVLQFVRGNMIYERPFLDLYFPNLEILQPEVEASLGNRRRARIEYAKKALEIGLSLFTRNTYDLIVLDDILTALSENSLCLGDVLALIKAKPTHLGLILTGTGPPFQIIEIADLVTEVVPTKYSPHARYADVR